MTAPCKIRSLSYNPKTMISVVEITITEGRNHQVKKMFKSIGATVIKLKRVRYAFFELEVEQLSLGEFRPLRVKEIKKLFNLIENEE